MEYVESVKLRIQIAEINGEMPTVHQDGDIVSGDMYQLTVQKLAEDANFHLLEIFSNETK